MKDFTEQQKQEHQITVQKQIAADLDMLAHKYDSIQLASLMFWKACLMFQGIHSLGMWSIKDVEAFTTEAMKDILVPLPQDMLPQQAVLTPDGLQPITSQRKLS